MKRKRETPLTIKTKSGKILTHKEATFCVEYVSNLGNGCESAIIAYDIDKTKKGWNLTARAIASENLTKPHILEYIREIWDDKGLNDEIVDVETSFLVKQMEDKNAKAKGIEIYNKIKGRYAPEQHEHTFKGASDEELRKRASELISRIISNNKGVGEEGKGEPS